MVQCSNCNYHSYPSTSEVMAEKLYRDDYNKAFEKGSVKVEPHVPQLEGWISIEDRRPKLIIEDDGFDNRLVDVLLKDGSQGQAIVSSLYQNDAITHWRWYND